MAVGVSAKDLSGNVATLIRTVCAFFAVLSTVFVFQVTAFRDHATSEVASLRASITSLQELQEILTDIEKTPNLSPKDSSEVSCMKRHVEKMVPAYKTKLYIIRRHYRVAPSVEDHSVKGHAVWPAAM